MGKKKWNLLTAPRSRQFTSGDSFGTKLSLLCKFPPQAPASSCAWGPRAASASRPATPVATAHLLGRGSTPLPGRGCGRPALREWGAQGRHHTGILPCSCPWLCQKAEKARGLHTEVFTFLLRKTQPRTWHVLKHLVPAEAWGPGCTEFPISFLPASGSGVPSPLRLLHPLPQALHQLSGPGSWSQLLYWACFLASPSWRGFGCRAQRASLLSGTIALFSVGTELSTSLCPWAPPGSILLSHSWPPDSQTLTCLHGWPILVIQCQSLRPAHAAPALHWPLTQGLRVGASAAQVLRVHASQPSSIVCAHVYWPASQPVHCCRKCQTPGGLWATEVHFPKFRKLQVLNSGPGEAPLPVVHFSLSSREDTGEGAPWSLFIRTPIPAGGASGKEPTCQRRRQETWVPSLDWEDALEEGMGTYARILAWRIPWIEESGGLQSMGS